MRIFRILSDIVESDKKLNQNLSEYNTNFQLNSDITSIPQNLP